MIFTIKSFSQYTMLKLTGMGFQFRFNLKDLFYLEDGLLLPNQDVELTPYFPSTSEQAELLKEYTDWCTQFEQEPNETLVNILSFIDYWKSAKMKLVNKIADLFEQSKNNDMYFTSSLGFRVNSDRRSLTNITSLIEYFDVKNQDGTIGFKDYDNAMQRLNKEQLQTIKAELVSNSENLYSQKWNTQLKIAQAQTLDELNAIEIKFDMMDFTPEQATTSSSDEEDIVQTLANLLGNGV